MAERWPESYCRAASGPRAEGPAVRVGLPSEDAGAPNECPWRVYSAEGQQRPLTTARQPHPQHTPPAPATAKHPALPPGRDEEAAGSNPATPTQVTGHLRSSRVAFRVR